MKVTLLGASGTIGRATLHDLETRGIEVATPGRNDWTDLASHMTGSHAVISCIASRTGVPWDAWRVDYGANADALRAARKAGVGHFVMLSAICVQKPKLAFQRAKLTFEEELAASGMTYSIVRPTAFFKSLSGQLSRLKSGKPFLVFGDGELTACKPISDRDLARYVVSCLEDPEKHNRILPIGGPGPALTPKAQGAILAEVLGVDLKVRRVPPAMLSTIAKIIAAPGKLMGIRGMRFHAKAEMARIGHYYATESMLLWDGARYNAEATPEFGNDTLEDHYRALLSGEIRDDRGAHAVF